MKLMRVSSETLDHCVRPVGNLKMFIIQKNWIMNAVHAIVF